MTTTSEVLNRAADLIEEHGWKSGMGWRESDGGLCLEGGVIAALGWKFETLDLADLWACPAYRAVQSYLGLSQAMAPSLMSGLDTWTPMPTQPLWSWNDRQWEARRVIEVLRACAVIEASREREAAEVSA